MASLEQEIRRHLSSQEHEFTDNCNSTTKPDFIIQYPAGVFAVDAKEKLNPYRLSNWPVDLPQNNLFILDELGIRKLMFYGFFSAAILRVNEAHYLFTAMELLTIPKKRVNREIAPGVFKGKWMINLEHASRQGELSVVFDGLDSYIDSLPVLVHHSPCYRDYGELGSGGIPRKNEWRKEDYEATR